MTTSLLKKYNTMRDVDEEDRIEILRLKDRGLMKIGIDVKREKLLARVSIPKGFTEKDVEKEFL